MYFGQPDNSLNDEFSYLILYLLLFLFLIVRIQILHKEMELISKKNFWKLELVPTSTYLIIEKIKNKNLKILDLKYLGRVYEFSMIFGDNFLYNPVVGSGPL